MRTVASTYLKFALETCVAEGCGEEALLRVIPGGRKSLDDVLLRFPCSVFLDLLYMAEDLLGETGIGIVIGQRIRPTTFLDFGYGLMSCETLRQALAFNRRYQSVNQQLGRADLKVSGGSAFIEWETPDTPEYGRPAVETVLTGYVGIGKWITWTHGEELRSIRFRHKQPAHHELVQKAVECPVFYDEPVDRLEFDAALVDKPMPASNPKLVDQLSRRLDQILLSIDDPNSVRLAVYRILERALADDRPTIGSVSQKLGFSERTLRRRLAEENQSFRSILSDVRRDVCEIYMNEPNRKMVEISQLLGYSEHSAFIRAFRGWFGVTPRQYQSGKQP